MGRGRLASLVCRTHPAPQYGGECGERQEAGLSLTQPPGTGMPLHPLCLLQPYQLLYATFTLPLRYLYDFPTCTCHILPCQDTRPITPASKEPSIPRALVLFDVQNEDFSALLPITHPRGHFQRDAGCIAHTWPYSRSHGITAFMPPIERPGLLQIGGAKPLGEPALAWCKEVMGCLAFALRSPTSWARPSRGVRPWVAATSASLARARRTISGEMSTPTTCAAPRCCISCV